MNSDNLLRQLVAFLESKGEALKYETSNSKYQHQFLKVSSRKTDSSKIDVKNLLDQVFDIGDESSTVCSLLEYLLDNYEDETLTMLREQRLIPKVMNEYQIAATMDYANIYPVVWKKLVHCLKTFQDVKGKTWRCPCQN